MSNSQGKSKAKGILMATLHLADVLVRIDGGKGVREILRKTKDIKSCKVLEEVECKILNIIKGTRYINGPYVNGTYYTSE